MLKLSVKTHRLMHEDFPEKGKSGRHPVIARAQSINMSSAPDKSSSVVVAGASRGRWPFYPGVVLKFLLLITALISPYISAFLTFPLPALSDSFDEIRWVCWIFVFFFSISALLRHRWMAIAIFSAAWVWLIFTPYRFNEPTYWLWGAGFRIHASPIESYLAGCRLVSFLEKGVRQTVGFCEGADEGTVIRSVYYDTTREFGLPSFQRTPEWKLAMSQIVEEEFLQYSALPLSGNFFVMSAPLEMSRG
jgi:hypothetical protein